MLGCGSQCLCAHELRHVLAAQLGRLASNFGLCGIAELKQQYDSDHASSAILRGLMGGLASANWTVWLLSFGAVRIDAGRCKGKRQMGQQG